jgi:protein-tyrosine-phosphatase/predicted ATP-grasp superfamily ATP-dependent carboligase
MAMEDPLTLKYAPASAVRAARARSIHPSRKVLVLGDDTRSFLSVVRSLGRGGIEVHVGWCSAGSPARASRYITRVHALAPYRMDDAAWQHDLECVLDDEGFDLVIPVCDPTILPLREARHALGHLARLYLLDDRAFEVVNSKGRTAALARSLGIPVAREVPVTAVEQTASAVATLGLPLVLKPGASFQVSDLAHKCEVRKAHDEEAARRIVAGMLRHGDEVLAQENFVGVGVGIEALVERGQILTAFQHVRVHERLAGGGSAYRRSAPLDPALVDAAGRLLRALDYTGVAMVEFRQRPDTGAFILLEINGRFWGSLPLAVAAGADFPLWLYQLLVDGRRDFPRRYAEGVYCRNTTLDARWMLENLRADRRDPALSTLPLWKVAAEVGHVAALREHNDTLVLDDPGPGLTELRQLGANMGRTFRRKLGRALLGRGPVRAAAIARARPRLPDARCVLFVCKGNICRSPFAAAYARTLLPPSVEVRSAGYYPAPNRRSPEEAVAVARELGVDLSGHRSSVLTDAMIADADVVVTFDDENVATVLADFPAAASKHRRFCLLAADVPLSIRDPYGEGPSAFREVYALIRAGLDVACRR